MAFALVTTPDRRLQKKIALVHNQINNLPAWISFDNATLFFFFYKAHSPRKHCLQRETQNYRINVFFFSPIEICHLICSLCSAERTGRKGSPTPQVVHSNSSCPLHSEQVGWQRTHWFFDINCPLGHFDDTLHPLNPNAQTKITNARRSLMTAPEDLACKRAEDWPPHRRSIRLSVQEVRCLPHWTPAHK